MFDRSDLLWRDDDPTPATKPARDNHAKDDQARQVTARPSAPGHTRAPADEPARDGEARPQAPAGHDVQGFEQEPAGPREHPEWTPQQRANDEAHHARLARIREERAPEWARQDARDRQDEAARKHARDARAHDRRPTRADRARQERAGHRATPDPQTRTTGHRREHDTRARRTPRRATGRAAAGPHARAMRWPTWGSIEPCPTQTSPSGILTPTPTPPGAAVNHLIRGGLIEEHEATGPEGHTFKVLTATALGRGRRAARGGRRRPRPRAADVDRASSSPPSYPMTRPCIAPRWTSGRASRPRAGASTRVRIDAELKATVATATEKARAEGGDRAAARGEARSRARPRAPRRQSRPRVVSRRPTRHRGRRWT